MHFNVYEGSSTKYGAKGLVGARKNSALIVLTQKRGGLVVGREGNGCRGVISIPRWLERAPAHDVTTDMVPSSTR